MINVIWFLMIFISIVISIFIGFKTGDFSFTAVNDVTTSIFESADVGVSISLGLVGIITVWSGLMKVAEEAGLVQALGKLLSPIMVRLFPDVPKDHPAMGSIVMNMAANMLGLDNAATPLGLKAMEELQSINPNKDTASNAMCMFLAINTSAVTLIPTSIMGYRLAAGSANPAEIIGTALFATTMSTIAAIIAVKLFERMRVFKIN